jgi:upstream activation factor subunit UAF30
MARSNKPASVSAPVVPAPEVVKSAPVVVPAAKATKAAPAAIVVPEVTKDAKDAKDVVPSAEADVQVSVIDKLDTKILSLSSLVKEIINELKSVKKEYKVLKDKVDRVERKRAKAISNPNGFAKPCKIKTELCDFLAVPHGSEMSRTDVTRGVNAYIKKHNLNKPENKRYIVPDDKLRSLLGVKPTEEVSYFQLQRYLSPHFIKEIKVVPVAVAVAVATA